MPVDPIRASNNIRDSYISYLTTTFPLRDRRLAAQFSEGLAEPGRFVKGPILEATPPFKVRASIDDLVKEGVLSKQFQRIPESELPSSRPLYLHQEQAVRKVVMGQRNIVVASGTGSGKTEAFLVPILNHLFRQRERGDLAPGVRALLLYPMNALANDQMERLRKLLRNHPDITFGRYTGETKEGEKEARDAYIQMFGEEPIPNEMVSRKAMRYTPPHLLLTNYAMLEYLLLRPKDTPFFDGPFADSWRYVVLDEAHTYSGAKGIEIGMLLRRLKDRIVEGKPGILQCFATSATLGHGIEDAPEIVRFAEEIFGESFEWVAGDEARQDVVVAERERWSLVASGETAYRPDLQLYGAWQEALNGGHESVGSLVDIGKRHGVPECLLQSSSAAYCGRVSQFLYHVMRCDGNVMDLRTHLQQGPGMMDDVAGGLFAGSDDARQVLVALVGLASRAKPDEQSLALLPARYHLFLRAIEGAYLQISPEPRVMLERTDKTVDGSGRKWPVFEMATCRNCGSLYLAGQAKPDPTGRGSILLQVPVVPEEADVGYFLVVDRLSGMGVSDEDDEIVFDDTQTAKWERYTLCTSCGQIWADDTLLGQCDCPAEYHISVLKAPPLKNVHYCPACGRRNPSGQVLRFLAGTDASASVIATSMYQAGVTSAVEARNSGPSSHPVVRDQLTPKEDGEGTDPEWSSDWSIATSDESKLAATIDERVAEPSRLLVFSDSRQDAAYFAPYLNRTYGRILSRRLIWKVIQERHDLMPADRWRLADLVSPLLKEAEKAQLFGSGVSSQARRTQVWKWLMSEFLLLDRHNSLESLGLLSFVPVKPRNWGAPRPLTTPPWNLTPEEVWALLRGLLDTIRVNGAITFPDYVNPTDEEFAPRNRQSYVRQNGSNSTKHVLAWCPKAGGMNGRLDYLRRIATKIGVPKPKENSGEFLASIWSRYFGVDGGDQAMWGEHFYATNMTDVGTVYQMRHEMWELDMPSKENDAWYRCDTCGIVTRVNVKGVCPAYLCQGTLHPLGASALNTENHYARLYKGLVPARLRAEEHTAQLTSEAAAELQTQFTKGNVNVLSCSTTFELGVNLGSLEIVFLRNMPPTPANYVQRAGRAGRKTESAAFVATFARRRPHDREFFRDPYKMVSGKIKPPHFTLDNEKIVRRHINAMAIAYLWRVNPESFRKGDVQGFFEDNFGPNQLKALLDSKPPALLSSLRRTVPPTLHEELGIEGWAWVNDLFDAQSGPIPRASDEYHHDREELEKVLADLQASRKRSDHILASLNTVNQRELVGYLASRSVLPKYGFPVDVVELKISHHSADARRLELDRDLRIALSEYAPGSKVVAGGKVWTSRYLRRLPRRAWPRYRYALCPNCGSYHRVLAESAEELDYCTACHTSLTHAPQRGQFIVPEFGFITEFEPPRDPPPSAPERSYSTRVFLWGKSLDPSETAVVESNAGIIRSYSGSKGRLAVLNTGRGKGFMICPDCGFAVGPGEQLPRTHNDSHGSPCRGTFQRIYLGHEFDTDVLLVTFPDYRDGRQEFWLSLLYGLLEGAALALDIERGDLDGCLYPISGDPRSPALVLYDDVPGGAGHVRRVNDAAVLKEVLRTTLDFLSSCECGTSCSGCLRNYRNQYCHDVLDRKMVVEFLEKVVEG